MRFVWKMHKTYFGDQMLSNYKNKMQLLKLNSNMTVTFVLQCRRLNNMGTVTKNDQLNWISLSVLFHWSYHSDGAS